MKFEDPALEIFVSIYSIAIFLSDFPFAFDFNMS